jgi:hypothetical protein
MRSIYDSTTGNDVTSSVQSTLLAGRTFFTRYLFRFQVLGFWFTNATNNFVDFAFTTDFPIFVNKYQVTATGATQLGSYSGGILQNNGVTFFPDQFDITSSIDYDIGFADHPVEITWYIDDTRNYSGNSGTGLNAVTSPNGLTMKQAMLMGAFNEAPFWIHQALYTADPTKGGTFLGTVLMFRGYIRKVVASKNSLILSITSLMDAFQQTQVPTQTFTPNCRAVPFLPAAGGTYAGHWVSIASVTSPTQITFNIGATLSIPEDALRDYYIGFTSNIGGGVVPWGTATPPAPFWRIRGNPSTTSSSTVTCYFYEPPIVPASPSDIPVMGQTSLAGSPKGFPYIPPPELSI